MLRTPLKLGGRRIRAELPLRTLPKLGGIAKWAGTAKWRATPPRWVTERNVSPPA